MRCQPVAADAARRFTNLRAFVLPGHADAIAPLLGRLTEWGVRVEHAAAPDCRARRDATGLRASLLQRRPGRAGGFAAPGP